MKKLFLILLVTIGLFSCGKTDISSNYLPTRDICDKPYTVTNIKGNFTNKHFCVYNLQNHTDFLTFDNSIFVVDSVGRFAIGDTVQILLIKIKK